MRIVVIDIDLNIKIHKIALVLHAKHNRLFIHCLVNRYYLSLYMNTVACLMGFLLVVPFTSS